MAGKSIVETSVSLLASAQQFVSEFKRADNESRRATASIDKEVDKLTKNVKRKFSVGDVGKDFLRGLGLGSGFQAATTVVEQFADYWKQAAESATRVAEQSERSTAAVLKGLEKRRTAGQNLTELQAEQRRLFGQLEAARVRRGATAFNAANITSGNIGDRSPTGVMMGLWSMFSTAQRNFVENNKVTEDAERLKTELQELANAIEDAKEKIKADDFKAAQERARIAGLERPFGGLGGVGESEDDIASAIARGRQAAGEFNKEQQRLLKPDEPLTDAFTRRGLLTGAVGQEEKKQSSLLERILKAIERQSIAKNVIPAGAFNFT